MTTSTTILYTISIVTALGCASLFIATTDLYDLSCQQLHSTLSLYERLTAEIVAELDRLAVDNHLSDFLYSEIVSTVELITDPANAALVREAVGDGKALAQSPSVGNATVFDSSMEALAADPDLQTRYAEVIVKAVRAARLWDLAYQGSRRSFLQVPAWATNPWRERAIIESSRYDGSLVRVILNRLRVADASLNPLRHAF